MERQPKIGERVLYYPAKDTKIANDPSKPFAFTTVSADTDVKTNGYIDGPVAAVITRQHGGSDRRIIPCVNLTIFPDQTAPVFRSSVAHASNKVEGAGYWTYPEE